MLIQLFQHNSQSVALSGFSAKLRSALLSLPMAFVKLVEQVIVTSSSWSHCEDVIPQPLCVQSSVTFSLPLQKTCSSHIVPFPGPYILSILSPERLQKFTVFSHDNYAYLVSSFCVIQTKLNWTGWRKTTVEISSLYALLYAAATHPLFTFTAVG